MDLEVKGRGLTSMEEVNAMENEQQAEQGTLLSEKAQAVKNLHVAEQAALAAAAHRGDVEGQIEEAMAIEAKHAAQRVKVAEQARIAALTHKGDLEGQEEERNMIIAHSLERAHEESAAKLDVELAHAQQSAKEALNDRLANRKD